MAVKAQDLGKSGADWNLQKQHVQKEKGKTVFYYRKKYGESFEFKVLVNENFSTLLDFVFFFFLDFWHDWVLNFILAEKESQKVLFNPSKMSLF